MMRRMQTSLRRDMERDRVLFQRHWMIYLVAGLLNLGLVLWACLASAQTLAPENAGRLLSLAYSYGSYNGGYMDFTITRQEDGQLYLRAMPGNGLTLSVYAPVGEEVLEELSVLLAKEGIFAWNGFDGNDEDILDGFSFGLSATFEQGALAARAYERYPNGFDQGHAALSGYLVALAERIRPVQLTGPEDIQAVTLYYRDLDLRLCITQDSAAYSHGRITGIYRGDDLPPELLKDFLQQVVAFYNASAESGSTGYAFSLEVQAVVAGAETMLSLGAVPAEEERGCEQSPVEDMAQALAGWPEGLCTEAFALETYQNSFVYTGLLVWDPETLGEVWIDLPGMTVMVNGEGYGVSQAAMQRFSDAVDSQHMRLPFMSEANRIYKPEAKAIDDALSWWEELPKEGYAWMLGSVHVNGYTIFAYGGEILPAAWAERMRAPVQALLEEASPTSRSAEPFY